MAGPRRIWLDPEYACRRTFSVSLHGVGASFRIRWQLNKCLNCRGLVTILSPTLNRYIVFLGRGRNEGFCPGAQSSVVCSWLKVGLSCSWSGSGCSPPPVRGPGKRRLSHVPRRPRSRRRTRRQKRSRSLSIPTPFRRRFTRSSRASTAMAIWTASNCRTMKNSRSSTAPCATTTWPRNLRRVRTGNGPPIRLRRPRPVPAATASTTCFPARRRPRRPLRRMSTELCAKCHGSQLKTVDKSPHGGRWSDRPAATCTDCHRTHSVIAPSEPLAQVAACGACHEQQARENRDSLHGRAAVKGDPAAPNCIICHDHHAIKRHTDPGSPTAVQNIPLLCGRCHREGTEVSLQHDIPQDRILENFSMSVHGDALFNKGLTVTAVCTSCHTAHNILDHNNPASSINRANVAQTCMQCHARIEEVHVKVIEGRLWEEEPHKVPSCVECHQPHKIRRRTGDDPGGIEPELSQVPRDPELERRARWRADLAPHRLRDLRSVVARADGVRPVPHRGFAGSPGTRVRDHHRTGGLWYLPRRPGRRARTQPPRRAGGAGRPRCADLRRLPPGRARHQGSSSPDVARVLAQRARALRLLPRRRRLGGCSSRRRPRHRGKLPREHARPGTRGQRSRGFGELHRLSHGPFGAAPG